MTITRQTWLKLVLAGAVLSYAGCTGPAGPGGLNGVDGQDGVDGANGTSCSVIENADGTKTITCQDGTSVVISDGTDAESCSVASNGNGTSTITCPDGTSVVVTNGTNGTSCTVAANADGSKTITCSDGTRVVIRDGENAMDVATTNFHGKPALQSIGSFSPSAANPKFFAKATITSASADAAGVVTVEFTAKDAADMPILNLPKPSFNIVKLTNETSPQWVAYLYTPKTAGTGAWPNSGSTTTYYQATSENNGTYQNLGNGAYSYRFAKNLTTATAGTTPITYDRSLTHRVTVMMGGSSGATATAHFDFVPDGTTANARTRDIVQTDTCQSCHGWEFRGHGGNRLTVENCVTCHNPDNLDPQSLETIDFKVMIHKIHAGGELASIPGADGKVWNDPATTADESADNGSYAIWGYGNSKHEWWKAGFPAVIENCTKCHQGTGANVDAWKTQPSREACGSCHDLTDFDTATPVAPRVPHTGGAGWTNVSCGSCHPSSGDITAFSFPVPAVHSWTEGPKADPRHVPEFDVVLSIDNLPARGYFIKGEAPIVKVVLNQKGGGPIDHLDIAQDGTAEGCLATGCPSGDNALTTSALFVHGPRSDNNPVLTTVARARVLATAGPTFDLTGKKDLQLKIDNGVTTLEWDASGGDIRRFGNITVAVPAAATPGPFVDGLAAATHAQLVTWLNANTAFKARAIAYLDELTGRLAIRSKNLGKVYAVQLLASDVTTTVFGGNTKPATVDVSTAAVKLAKPTDPATDDPKVDRSNAGYLLYTLDPVDNLRPGTYTVNAEIADAGRVSDTNYRTPSVAKLNFQVGVATEEKPVAGGCDSCHQGPDGKGFVLDFVRHYKIFDATAIDQCGACHDYQPQKVELTNNDWTGSRPISRRVHAVHYGSSLAYPLSTVAYGNGDPVKGRNWDITLPQDVRNCEGTCHQPQTTSGTWATNANRLACSGCHDSDEATGHIGAMVTDPTPADPWSGDEVESCRLCH